MTINIESFRLKHPYVILNDSDTSSLEPLRFHSLKCAAHTAAHLKCGVKDEWSGDEYDLIECVKIVNGK
jgi:hypothetical protein